MRPACYLVSDSRTTKKLNYASPLLFCPSAPHCQAHHLGSINTCGKDGEGSGSRMSHRSLLLKLSEQKSVISQSKPDPFTVPQSRERLRQVAQEETQPSFQPLPSLSPHTRHAAPPYLTPDCPGIRFPQAPYHFGVDLLSSGQSVIASGLAPSSPSSKLARSKMSLVYITLHAPHGPQKAQSLSYGFQQPHLLLLAFPSTNLAIFRLHPPPNTLCYYTLL